MHPKQSEVCKKRAPASSGNHVSMKSETENREEKIKSKIKLKVNLN
jgi:hypothetical protein